MLPLFVGLSVWSMFCNSVIFSFAINSLRKRERADCLALIVMCMLMFCTPSSRRHVIVAFPDYTCTHFFMLTNYTDAKSFNWASTISKHRLRVIEMLSNNVRIQKVFSETVQP